MSEEQFFEIEALECVSDDEVESFINIEPKEREQEDRSVNKTKRLACMIDGCNYTTDRRRDLRRHRRSRKHIHAMANIADSDSDFERPLYKCFLCSYTTAKKFCFLRHNKSTKHRRREQALGDPLLKKNKVPVRRDCDSTSSQESDGNIYTCAACEFTTSRKKSFMLHKTTEKHRYIMEILRRNNKIITSGPMTDGEGVEFTPPESEDESDDKLNNYDRGIFDCDLCEYKTNSRYSFLRHKKSKKHCARVQEMEQMEEKSDSLPDADADSTQAVEIVLPCEEYEEAIEYEPEVHEEVVHESLEFQEIIYLPEEETGEEQHYFIVLSND
ncbi:uncharacterized protein LOC111070195 [Drosophila obscura]|uniref:uncharacterized protein LOC111070195 n=1 Tax=Drosophila obscura TaxID=7282 RepID=UPI001BB259DC|nr:uncharacterized protein LOC111070195 [Drosophila obscura]